MSELWNKDGGGERMTDREKAIVMAHTGICMLTGGKFQIFHEYVEDIMGRPILTHERGIASIADEIKAKSKDDFIVLCTDESSSENPNKWIPVSERQPKAFESVLVCYESQGGMAQAVSERLKTDTGYRWSALAGIEPIAWMPLPEPYKAESEDE